MDAAAKRREARRRRLLQNPEDRLQRIKNLTESSEKSSEGAGNDLSTDGEHSPSSTQNPSISQGEDPPVFKSPEIEECTEDTGTEHSCARLSGSVTSADSEILKREKIFQEQRKQSKPSSSNSVSSSDPLRFLPGLVTINSYLAEFQSVNTPSSTNTAVACTLAVVFRLSLELEWLTFFTGESLVMIFVVLYLPWLYFFGTNKVKIESLPGALFFFFRIVQDFAIYLFAFVTTHGLVSLFTDPSITEEDQTEESILT